MVKAICGVQFSVRKSMDLRLILDLSEAWIMLWQAVCVCMVMCYGGRI